MERALHRDLDSGPSFDMNSLDDPGGVTAPFWVCFLIQEMGKQSLMTPDELPADYACVSLKLLGGLGLRPWEGYPGSLLPTDPFLLLDPETLLCRAEHCPLPSLPLSLLPPFPVFHFCEHVAMEAAALDPGSGCGECECGHSCPLRGTLSGEGRSTTAAQFGRWGACWRLQLTEEGRASREDWAGHWESSQKRPGS